MMGSLGTIARYKHRHRHARTNPLGANAPEGSSRVRMRARMEQSFAASRREGIGLTLSDPAFFDAVILAKKKEAEASFFTSRRRRDAY
jgi:hypothetical protein